MDDSVPTFGRMRTGSQRWYDHHMPVIRLYSSGLTYAQMAAALGRTPDGIRSSVRRLRGYGLLAQRERVEWPIGR
jgi:hypothetical protein